MSSEHLFPLTGVLQGGRQATSGGAQLGSHDQHLEVAVSYLLPEAMSVMTWDVRIRPLSTTQWRLVDMDEVDLAEPLQRVPGLFLVEQCLERWLQGVGTQLELPFP